MQLLDNAFMQRATLADVKKLLAAGANVNARDEDGYSPLHRAVTHSNKPEVIYALLDAGANVNARTDGFFGIFGKTPLELIERNEALKYTPVRWEMHDLSYAQRHPLRS